MKTKSLYYGLVIFLFQACSTQEEKESFYTFIEQFGSDSVFQTERVKFPFQQHSWGALDEKSTMEINREEWIFLNFAEDEGSENREIDAYTRELVIYRDSAKLCYRGVDNGIYIDLDFYPIEGKWFLVSSNDFSN